MNDKHSGPDPYANLSRRTSEHRHKTGLLIVGATVLVIVLFGVVALVITKSGDDDSANGSGAADNATQEQAAVTVVGEPLPAYPDTDSYLAPPDDDPAVGKVAPELEGQTFDGTPLTIDPTDGRAKVVIFVAHWCPHCQREVPLIQKWLDDGNKPDNVDFYAVSTAVSADRPNYPPSAWLADEGWTPPVMLDSPDQTAAVAYGLPGFPYFVMMDASGKVTQRASGEVPIDEFGELVDTLSSASASS
ncbi:hypothetical protein BH10ACT3_BH10ACT3_15990 [soil metagenome]